MSRKRDFQSVKEVMSPKVIYIDGMATSKEAVDIMKGENIEALIVKKRNDQDAFGIIVMKDFIQGVIIPDRPSNDVNVYEIMTKPVICVPSNMDIRYVARLMVRIGLRVAPVEENGQYIGMISLSSLIMDNEFF